MYDAQINSCKLSERTVDWDGCVDPWLAKQPATDRAIIDAKRALGITELDDQFLSELLVISSAGIWKLREKAWKNVTRIFPDLAKYENREQWSDRVVTSNIRHYINSGLSQNQAAFKAKQVVANSKVGEAYSLHLQMLENKWIVKNVNKSINVEGVLNDLTGKPYENLESQSIASRAVHWGFISSTTEQERNLIATGERSIASRNP